jgi:hypothetical protein
MKNRPGVCPDRSVGERPYMKTFLFFDAKVTARNQGVRTKLIIDITSFNGLSLLYGRGVLTQRA